MNLAERIDSALFHTVGDTADSLSRPCYVVGGYVTCFFTVIPRMSISSP